MKELGSTLAQLILVIMVMVTLAVSTAAFSQWASPDDASSSIEQSETPAPPASASVAP